VQSGEEAVSESTSTKGTSDQIACQDPVTGELIQPGPGVECSVPEQAEVLEEPVVKDLEGGGKSVNVKGRFDKNQVTPATPNRIAVIDRKTGELITKRPSDPNAAVRYDRSIARIKAMMNRQSRRHPAETLYPEVLTSGGVKVHLQGRFQVPLVATISEDGQTHLGHQHHQH
jgi:hypothetical protein